MSNIYIQEPPTSGKILLKTSAGDIDIELWCRETPKTCRNFIQLCMEGYYNNTIFHRLVKGFIAQGGDPNGDGTGGESIYGKPFKDEFHSRLRFTRRGLVAMANAGRDDNGSQFFFTLGEAMELQNKHTIFGKVTGDTIFNMLKIEEGIVDHNERPMYPQKILKTEILLQYFDDIIPRKIEKAIESKEKKQKKKGVKNFGLLSFGAEAEEDEEETNVFVQKNAGKAKSTHDMLEDPKLSKETATFVKIENEIDGPIEIRRDTDEPEILDKVKEKIRNKLNSSKSSAHLSKKVKLSKNETAGTSAATVIVSDSDDSDDVANEIQRERNMEKKKKADEIRSKIVELKKTYKKDKQERLRVIDDEPEKPSVQVKKETENELIEQFVFTQKKYSHLKTDLPKKGALREQHTLELLNKFKNKIAQAKGKHTDLSDGEENVETKEVSNSKITAADKRYDRNDVVENDIKNDNWLSHTLRFEDGKEAILAKDASTKQDDWYDVYDPRNPLNKRKRGDVEARSGRSKK